MPSRRARRGTICVRRCSPTECSSRRGTRNSRGGARGATLDGIDPAATAGPQTTSYSPDLIRVGANATAHGELDSESAQWWAAHSYAGYGVEHPIRIPTLLAQGTADPLFQMNEALATFRELRAIGTPVKFVTRCSSHAPCPYADDGEDHVDDLVVQWFERYLKHRAVETGPAVEYLTNDGHWDGADSIEAAATSFAHGAGSGTVVNAEAITSEDPDQTQTTRAGVSNPNDPGTLTIETDVAGGDLIVGLPHASVAVDLAGPGINLFFKLVDREARKVVDLQEIPARIDQVIGTNLYTVDLDLAGVVYHVPAGHHIDLQVATSSPQFAPRRGPSSATIDVAVSLPVQRGVSFPAPTPTPTPTQTDTPSPGASPATAQVVPAVTVSGAGRAGRHDAPNTFVAFTFDGFVDATGGAHGTFSFRDSTINGERANITGVIEHITVDGDTATITGSCDVGGLSESECSVVAKDAGAPGGTGKDWLSFSAPGYREYGTINQGDVQVQRG